MGQSGLFSSIWAKAWISFVEKRLNLVKYFFCVIWKKNRTGASSKITERLAELFDLRKALHFLSWWAPKEPRWAPIASAEVLLTWVTSQAHPIFHSKLSCQKIELDEFWPTCFEKFRRIWSKSFEIRRLTNGLIEKESWFEVQGFLVGWAKLGICCSPYPRCCTKLCNENKKSEIAFRPSHTNWW